MTPVNSLILIEFNELCPTLMERFIRAGHLPHFQRLFEESQVYTTDAEEEGDDLVPWVAWVTVHSGLGAAEHQVKSLSEGALLKQKALWDLLSDAGKRVWVCGSMNPRCDVPINGYLLPDPWSEGIDPQPAGDFETYHRYVRAAVQEHTNDSKAKGGAGSFLWYLLRHGLSMKTLFAAIRQLASERIANTRWKRATIMDQFQWDLFVHYYKKCRPNFSTFFLNSTAHLQHCYWREMEPEKFLRRPSEKEQQGLQGAILYGYKKMDKLIQRFLRMAGRDTTLVLCTAHSQQAYLGHDAAGGRHYYRIKTDKVLVDQLGITTPFSCEPLMAEQFHLRFASDEEAEKAENQLANYRVKDNRVFQDNHTRLFHTIRTGNAILTQCRCTTAVPHDAVITDESSKKQIAFFDVFYLLDTLKSGTHHPDGILWIRNPDRRHVVHKEKVSIRTIAPTVLKMFNVTVPAYMTAEPLSLVEAERQHV